MSLKEIVEDLGSYYDFGKPISHDMFSVYPILKADLSLPILGLFEAEDDGLAWIQETKGSESVEMLEAINRSKLPVLVPYLHQVEGGKQDRTIFEPIIVPIGNDETNPLPIPAKCIEQSRWTYSSSRGLVTSHKFKSAKTRMATQMANVSTKTGDQFTVWESVGAAAQALEFSTEEAPTSSYREIQEKAYAKDKQLGLLLEKLSSALNFENQVGIACFFGGKILGIEIFGSPKLWLQFNEIVLKGFIADRIFLKDSIEIEKLEDEVKSVLKNEFQNIKLTEEKATGLGNLFRFSDDKWEGISIQYQGIPVHFHATKKQIDILKEKKRRYALDINRSTNQEFIHVQKEIMNEAAPEQIVQEVRQK